MRSFNHSSYSFRTHPDQALSDYHLTGYHIEENVFTHAECDQLIAASLELEGAKNQIFRPFMMPHKQNFLFLNAMKNPLVLQIIAHLVNGTSIGLQSEFFYCKPNTRGFSLHQDNFYVEAAYGVFASAWIALTDTFPEKGGLIVYPGSHREKDLPVRKLHLTPHELQDPNANNEETIVPPHYIPSHVSIPKGAALFIHGHLVHASNANQTNEWRYVLLNTYIKKDEPFRSGRYAKREGILLTL